MVEFDPQTLVIPGNLDPSKLNAIDRRIKPIIVYHDDQEDLHYVVDGRHAAKRAQLNGFVTIPGIVVEADVYVGRQTAWDRVLGMLASVSKRR